MCGGLGRCHFQHVFYTLSALCVNCGHPRGRRRTMRRTCFRAAVPGSVARLSMELQTPGLPEGQEEGRLGFFSSFSFLPFLCFPVDLSLSRSLTLKHSLSLLSSSLVKTAALQPAHRHPTLPAQPYPINHGRIITTVCMDPNEWRNFLGQ